MKNTKGSFASLNPNARIFKELINRKPSWWSLFINDNDLYIDIRKDNYINVYYYGSSIAKINFRKDFIAETHKNYQIDNLSRATKNNYCTLNLENLDKKQLLRIKKRILDYCCKPKNEEFLSEKQLQGDLRMKNPNFIDSEFQYNADKKIGKLRIDLTKLENNILTFIELKGINDNRLRNDEKRNFKKAEIIKQLEKYRYFLKKYDFEIINYYQKLIEIKQKLGLLDIKETKFEINTEPKLLIINTYRKMTDGRKKRISSINNLLKDYEIDYEFLNN